MKSSLKTFGLALLASASLLAPASSGLAAEAGPLSVGAAKVSITPTPDEFPYVVQRELPIVGVHDPVFVRAVVIDNGKARIAIVSVEVTTIPSPEEVVSAAAKAAGAPAANVLVLATHTHNVPLTFFHSPTPTATQAKEISRIKEAVATAVSNAASHLQPGKVAFVRSRAWVNINNGEAAGTHGIGDPTGPSDKTLDVIRLTNDKGEPVALVVNYATHSEVMFRSVTKDGGYEVTGDLPGKVSEYLEANSKGAPVVLYTIGAEGDQWPLFKSLQTGGDLPAGDEGALGWALLDAQARRLSQSVLEAVAKAPEGFSTAPLSGAVSQVSCPGEHRVVDHATGAFTVEPHEPVSIPISAIRIGDIAFAGVGGDVGSSIGMSIKKGSPVANTTVVTMTAGAIGYILPDASYEHPGHGLMGSLLKSGCAEPALVSGLQSLIGAK